MSVNNYDVMQVNVAYTMTKINTFRDLLKTR